MNYYKGSRIGTQILKFLGSTRFGRYTTGSTWTHGSHSLYGKEIHCWEYCYLRRQMVENGMHWDRLFYHSSFSRLVHPRNVLDYV